MEIPQIDISPFTNGMYEVYSKMLCLLSFFLFFAIIAQLTLENCNVFVSVILKW